jgi:ankyrin repeat protein
VTISNNRADTPLHNAARWNHPALVNELLLYGASYTATNNDIKTPRDLSSDDLVKELIWKASQGIIAIGSYSPLRRAFEPASHVGKVSSLGSGVKQSGTAKDVPNGGSGERSSSMPCDLIEEHENEAYVVIEGAEEDHHTTKQVSGNQEQLSVKPEVLQSTECGIEESKVGTEHPYKGEEPVKEPHPKSEDTGQKSEDEEFEQILYPGEELEQKPHPKTEEHHAEENQRTHSTVLDHRGEELDQKPHPILNEEEELIQRRQPKKDEKLISLLQAIEAFDR